MKRLSLPNPPNPDDPRYQNPIAYSRALYAWANKLQGTLEQTVNNNYLPITPPFVVTSFTTNTTLSGTSTGTDIANFVCSLVKGMTGKGYTTSNLAKPAD